MILEDNKSDKGITAKKNENFDEWYLQLVTKSDLFDYGPLKGTMAMKPDSYEIWEKIQDVFNSMIKESGHRNAYFPLLIPESLLKTEKEHFEGFTPEVFWVTHAGDNETSERLAIRPTSETIIYHFMSKWIRSWRDLPLLLNQWVNVLRAEIKMTKPFHRTSEFLWQEGHTAHATQEDAEKEVALTLGYYKKLAEEYLAVPVITGKKSEKEKFAGAVYTTTIEGMMPDGKALQMGTSHYLGQNFAKPFDVAFLNEKEEKAYAHTTSWGVSTRLIGGMLMVHGDDKGLVLPPKVAPTQVVIVPIFKTDNESIVMQRANEIKKALDSSGIRTRIDSRNTYSPGWKFNEWEMKGVPIRIELGNKEVQENKITYARRDSGEKATCTTDDAIKTIANALEEVQKALFENAKRLLESKTIKVSDYGEFKKKIEEKAGFVIAYWCEEDECEEKIKDETKATTRVIKEDTNASSQKCIYCGKEAKKIAYFARAY